MIVSCTGPAQIKRSERGARLAVMQAMADFHLSQPDEFRTGAAYGIDTLAFFLGLQWWEPKRGTRHRVFVPAGKPHNTEVPARARELGLEVVEVHGGYLKRDDALVDGATVLLAFPDSMREHLRSGTWATIRRAWKRDMEVRYYPLDNKHGPVLRLP